MPRSLSAAALAAVDAVVTSPGHVFELAILPTPARWSDIGTVVLSDGRVFTGLDMRVSRLGFQGDAKQSGFAIDIGNLDSAIGALLLANDLASTPLYAYGFDRAAIALADFVPLGTFSVTGARIGIDRATLECSPVFYSAPFRRVDPANGFNYATPEGTVIVWSGERITLQRTKESPYG